jgi:uncharacterized repeat protein (TIGR01451 family)
MLRKAFLALLSVFTLATSFVLAQFPYPSMPSPIPPAAPLMYVRFTGPKNTKITIYRGSDAGQTLELPVTVGFRPGYAYRLSVFDVPGFPWQVFSPSLEVRGSLAFSPKMKHVDFPAHINFSIDEFQRVATGSFVKKVIALERPDMAIPLASKADEPIEVPVPTSRDLYTEAAERGQPLIVFQLGQRFVTPQELNALAIPGTVLLPGERVLGTPRVPPYLTWNWCPVWDPVAGPRPPSEFMTIYDGGDSNNPAGFNRFGKLKGLDPTDTVAEYMDSKGNLRIAASNRVGLCVPRFIVFQNEMTLAVQKTRINLEATLAARTPFATTGQIALKQQLQNLHAEALGGKLRLSGMYNQTSTSVVGRMLGLEIKSNLMNTASVEGVAAGPKMVEPADGPLVIIKWPDKECASVGEIVTFYLKYRNTGGQPITNVAVADNLTQRLEYVKGTARTDRDALFTTTPNEVGSTVLRWEFTAPLQPRETGIISFQVRVR